jgi:ABC-type antimicrobial peptide transport system permease subunit
LIWPGMELGLNILLTVKLGGLVMARKFYISTMENIKEFAAVKAKGGTDRDIITLIAKVRKVAAFDPAPVFRG